MRTADSERREGSGLPPGGPPPPTQRMRWPREIRWVTGVFIVVAAIIYLAEILVDLRGINFSRSLAFLGPSTDAVVRMGASGAIPILEMNRWWTPLSAGWLHGGILHIGLNMMVFRQLFGPVAQIWGHRRALAFFFISSAMGFVFSSFSFYLLLILPEPLMQRLGIGMISVGASAGIMGLLGALLVFSRRTGRRQMSQSIWSSLLFIFVFGISVPQVDNWGHLGGFLSGWLLASLWSSPKRTQLDGWVGYGLFVLSICAVFLTYFSAV